MPHSLVGFFIISAFNAHPEKSLIFMNQQPVIGFFLALIAAAMWGALPIALQQVLQVMDSQTAVWYRFSVAAFGVFIVLATTKTLPKLTALHRRYWWLMLLGVVGLSLNFFLYNVALNYIPATTSQVLSPLSSFVMLFTGVLLFKEKIGKHQKIGLIILIIGLILFFNDRFADFLQPNTYLKGVVIALSAGVIWVAYGVAQKMLLTKFSSQQVLLMIYIGCTIVFTPFATVSQIIRLDVFQFGSLIFCCVNTLIAYGAYAEALNRWDVSKVSAMMTQIPVFTIIFSELLTRIVPQRFNVEELNPISYIGAVVVVSGALFSAIGHKFSRR